MIVHLPFPPKELSPNGRHDRRAISGIRATYRDTCYYLTKQAAKAWAPITCDIAMSLTFVQPDLRRRDVDNMLASAKAAIDGFAKALKMDDRQFKPITVDWVREKGSAGALILELSPMALMQAADEEMGAIL